MYLDVPYDYDSLWLKTQKALFYIMANYEGQFDFVLKVITKFFTVAPMI